MAEDTSTSTTSASGATDTSTGAEISAAKYRDMVSVLDELISHNHSFYDDYTTVCDCQCQCDCGRGAL
jgi:hypothetical protein